MGRRALAVILGLALGVSAASPAAPTASSAALFADRMSGDIVGVHDPAAIKAGATYYVFSTTRAGDGGEIPIRISTDLLAWRRAGSVFPAIPDWAKRAVPAVRELWAPDISFAGGQYRLYYSVSSFGSNVSAIGLATSPTLDPAAPGYGWTDRGMVVRSTRSDDFNAIDPSAFVDADGKAWLAFGSFWTGIKLIELDPATGLPLTGAVDARPLVRRSGPDAVEAPFLFAHGGEHYLFASYDFCCRGADSSYYTVVGRAKAVTGPYLDYDGKPMTKGFGQVVLHAKLDPGGRWRGPGHVAVLHDGTRDWIVYHAYDARAKGAPTLRIQPLGWTADGWPVAH